MKFKNFISINIIAFLGYFVTFFLIIEFLPFKIYPHLSLVEMSYIITIIYLLIAIMFIMFVIEIILNKHLSLKYIQSNCQLF